MSGPYPLVQTDIDGGRHANMSVAHYELSKRGLLYIDSGSNHLVLTPSEVDVLRRFLNATHRADLRNERK